MIKNLKQYNITKSKCNEFKRSLAELDSSQSDLMNEIMRDAIISQIESFEKELNEYDDLRNQEVRVIYGEVEKLADILIKARIAKRLTQEELANLCGMRYQQIQRYEENNYSSASLDKIIEIANILSLRFEPTKAIIRDRVIPVNGIDNGTLLRATKRLQSRKTLFTI